jgi:hypothetical protein
MVWRILNVISICSVCLCAPADEPPFENELLDQLAGSG